MFSFFKKFKSTSDSESDGKPSSSPGTPTRKRDDKHKEKSGSRERESTKKTGEVEEPPNIWTNDDDDEVPSGESLTAVNRRNFLLSLGTPPMPIRATIREEQQSLGQQVEHLATLEKMAALERQVEKMEALEREVEKMGALKKEVEKMDALKKEVEKMDALKKEVDKMNALQKEMEKMTVLEREVDKMASLKKKVEKMTSLEKEVEKMGELKKEVEKMEDLKKQVEKMSSLEREVEKIADLETQLQELETEKRSLVSQESRFQEQLAELGGQVTARENEANRLRYQMEDLQRDVLIKSSGVDRLQAEMAAAHKESECVRRRLRQLEDELTTMKQENRELQDELQRKAEEVQSSSSEESEDDEDNSERVAELENSVKQMEERVQQLQTELQEVQQQRDKLEQSKNEMEKEREEEMNIVQLALEDALEQKALIQVRFEQDFEKLRTVNTDREQQLLDDFEWKLREVEQACKKRLEDKDKAVQARIKETEIKLKLAEEQLKQLPQLKACEAEVVQLRGLTLEQQRSLRVTSRQAEQLQVSERIVKEEMTRLRGMLDKEKSNYVCMQSLHEKKMSDSEKKFQGMMEQQKTELTSQWEDRLRRECSRLKGELDHLHREEKHLAVESAKVQKEQEMRAAKQSWDARMQETLKEISTLKDRLTEKDTYYHGELEKAQTNADRDIFDLRRKLDKIDLSYQEQMEKLTEKHERDMDQLNWESERKVQQLEQNWQLQMSSTRATLELVKEQMERDAQDRLDAAEEKHHKQLDMQWERLTHDKDKALLELEEKHHSQVQNIKTELEKVSKTHSDKENKQLLTIIEHLKKELQSQTAVITDLQGNVDLLQGGMQVLNQEISSHNAEMQRVQVQAAHRLREREAQLEAEQRKKLAELKDRFAAETRQWQEQVRQMRDQYQAKVNYLAKLVQESEQKYKMRESRKEDVDTITQLRQALEEREQEVTCLTEEKRFYQMELMNRESTYRHQPVIGVLDPLQHHRKKGLRRTDNMTFNPVDVSDSKMSILLSNQKTNKNIKTVGKFEVRSRSLDAASSCTQTAVTPSASSPLLQ